MKLTLIDDSWYTRPTEIPERISSGSVVCHLDQGTVLAAFVHDGDYP
jgi:hypothetical protein